MRLVALELKRYDSNAYLLYRTRNPVTELFRWNHVADVSPEDAQELSRSLRENSPNVHASDEPKRQIPPCSSTQTDHSG